MPKLTKAYIDKVAPPASGYVIHWDDKVSGYGLRVTASGVRSFVAQGRVNGKAVIVTIGRYGLYTEDQARGLAQKTLQRMREGIDPRDTRKADEALKVTLRQVADAYLARPGVLKESSKSEINRHVEQVFEAWRDKPVVSITKEMCRKRYDDMYLKGLRGKKGAPAQARISMVTLRALINYARKSYTKLDGTSIIVANPVDIFLDEWKKNKPKKRDDRFIDDRKIGEVWHMLTASRANLIAAQRRADGHVNPQDADKQAGIDLTMFLMLTGGRRNEGAMLMWDRVHLDEDQTNCWWHLPDPKNKNPVWLPLSSQAIELLKARKPEAGDKTASRYCFPTRSKAGHVMDTRAPLERISDISAQKLSAHDLRRTFTHVGYAMCGIDLHKIELLTNHLPTGVTAEHYLQKKRLQYLQSEVQKIGNWIEREGLIAQAKAEGGNVVSMRAG